MADQRPTLRLHQVPAQKHKISFGVLLFQGFHQVGSVEVTRGFTRDDKVLHGKQN